MQDSEHARYGKGVTKGDGIFFEKSKVLFRVSQLCNCTSVVKVGFCLGPEQPDDKEGFLAARAVDGHHGLGVGHNQSTSSVLLHC